MRRTIATLALILAAGWAEATPLGDAFGPAINGERAQAGLGPLAESAALSAAAQAYAQVMDSTAHHAHVGADGSTQITRGRAAGCRTNFIGEDIAWGQRTAQAAFTGWMGSPAHHANIVMPAYRQFGIGGAGSSWVLMFADRC